MSDERLKLCSDDAIALYLLLKNKPARSRLEERALQEAWQNIFEAGVATFKRLFITEG